MSGIEYEEVEELVDRIFDRLGTDLVVGTPLGIGKPNNVLNELVGRALENPEIELEIWTALSLSKPKPDSELERRLVEPLSERLFGEYPNLRYDVALRNGGLPDNIEVHEFYFQPGKYMGNPEAQQHYHSVNYTHALRAFRNADPDLLLQLVGVGDIDGQRHYNIATNTDLSSDLIDIMLQARAEGERDLMIVGEVNRNMPFMHGDAPIPADVFDAVLNDEQYDFPLFGPPKEPVELVEHAIGLRVSSLIKDGGTLQIGIGSLGDAIASSLILRQEENEAYRELTDALGVKDDTPELIEEWGGLDTFEEGLYASTEMFVEGFLHLYNAGILKRETYDDIHIQQLANEGLTDDGIDGEVLEFLLDQRAIRERLDADDVEYLKEWGIFHEGVEYEDGALEIDGESIETDLGDEQARERIEELALGEELKNGKVLDGAFFLGSKAFYEGLRDLDESERDDLLMRSVQFTNNLYGEYDLKKAQRAHSRFINTGMKATLTGGVVSDGLEDGRVVSGVGGQFNFVNQAHELDDGRSILMIRSTRESGGDVESNIVWNYGHLTIPRHLRDIVVTEYGVADVLGKSDSEVIQELIKIADSRFQDELTKKAKDAGKIPQDWEVPEQYRNNYPEMLEATLGPYQNDGTLARFPFGTKLTDEELDLAGALRDLESKVQNRQFRDLADIRNVKNAIRVPPEAKPYLKRMDLDTPDSLQERALQRAVVLSLTESGAI